MESKKVEQRDLDEILKNKRELYDTMIEIAELAIQAQEIEKKIRLKVNTISFINTDLKKALNKAVERCGFDPSVYTVNCEGNVVEADEFSFENTPVEVPWKKGF